jgi:nitroreductase
MSVVANIMTDTDVLRLKNINWETAIGVRRSTRSFEMRPVDENTMSSLKTFVNEMKLPFKHDIKIRFFKADHDRRLYNSMKITPYDGMAFITSTDIPSTSAAGFAGEIAILYATSLGLDTCWYGHYSLTELERIMPHLELNAKLPKPEWGYGDGVVPGERAICITPLGYRRTESVEEKNKYLEERISELKKSNFFSNLEGLAGQLAQSENGVESLHQRKPIGTFLEEGISEESLPPEILYAFNLARKAPSAANSQHWRFAVSTDIKTISIAMPVGYKHVKWEHPDVDIGICACHFWLGLIMKNIDCKILLSEEQDRALWRFKI